MGKIVSGVCIVLLVLCAAGCKKDTTISRVAGTAANEPDQTFYRSKIIITENGVMNAVVQAESVKVFLDADFTSVDGGVYIEFYNKKGGHVSTLTAERGEVWGLYEKVDSLKAVEDVTIVSVDSKKRLETPRSLSWIASTRMVYAERNSLVKLTTEGAVEQGINFTARDDLSEYRMENVSGEYQNETLAIPGR